MLHQTPPHPNSFKLGGQPQTAQNTATKQHHQHHRQKSKKLSLASTFQQDSNNQSQLSQTVLVKAFNNSYTERMSGLYQELEVEDMMKMITQFAMFGLTGLDKKGSEDISRRKWCVVQVDQSCIKSKVVDRGILFCRSHQSDHDREEYNMTNNLLLPSTIRPYCLVLNMHEKQLHFQSHDITESRGVQFKLRQPILRSLQSSTLYFNTRYATEQQFTKYAESGDLLLFKDNHTFAKLQRAITHSPYDHVAIVYRTDEYGLCVFQSNSGLGVGLANWRRLIKNRWYEGIQQISWRKLQVHDKPKDFQDKFKKFVKQNLNKKFGITLPKLLKFRSCPESCNSTDPKSGTTTDKSYFCTQLTAELYKTLGLLDQEKSSTQYWPKDFADGSGIQILNGALDAERELLFEREILRECYGGEF